ncbi:MAG: GNAT family N-acetyltransferase [Bacteroidales bacterium]|nr:GNAT family N-acetyltransferase [Bacteroidales bacterium]
MDFKNCMLKSASLDNYDDYLKIRAEKKNLFWTGYEDPPEYNRFLNWYKNRIVDPNKHLYLLYYEKQCLGSLNIDYYDGYAYIGYSVKTKYEGSGYGTYLVRSAIELVKINKNISIIKAWINYQNVCSIKVIKKNNFYLSGITETRKKFGVDEKYYEFVLEI